MGPAKCGLKGGRACGGDRRWVYSLPRVATHPVPCRPMASWGRWDGGSDWGVSYRVPCHRNPPIGNPAKGRPTHMGVHQHGVLGQRSGELKKKTNVNSSTGNHTEAARFASRNPWQPLLHMKEVPEGQGKGSSRKKELSAPEKPGFSSSWRLALLNKVRLPGAPVALQRRRFEEEAKARRDVPRPTRKQDVSRRTTAPVNAMNSLCASGGWVDCLQHHKMI